jgi:uncharacterized RDD family membrane protein YckC
MEEKNSILEDFKTEAIEASTTQKAITTIVDLVIEVGILVSFYFLFPRDILLELLELNSFMRYILALVIILSYRFICILLAGKTIGMIICGVRYLNRDLQPLSLKERLVAVIASRNSNIKYYKA